MQFDVGNFLVQNYWGKPCVHDYSSTNTRVAVLVETRPSFFLPLVIKNFCSTLGRDWNLHLFLTKPAADLVAKELPDISYRLSIISLKQSKYGVAEYSRTLKSAEFWNYIKEPTVLIFQVDTLLLRPVPGWACEYDLIGAPCGDIDNNMIYNGGLSIRSRAAMLKVIQSTPPQPDDLRPEDVWFTEEMKKAKCYSLPTTETAFRFAAESVAYEGCVGVHGTDKYYLKCVVLQQLLKGAKTVKLDSIKE